MLLALAMTALAAPFPEQHLSGPAGAVDLRGQPAVVNLWASWCAPCIAELPLLDQLSVRLAGTARVVAVSVDTAWGPASGVVARLGLTLPTAHDPLATLPQRLKSPGLPATYVLDATGEIRQTVTHALDAAGITTLEAQVRALVSP